MHQRRRIGLAGVAAVLALAGCTGAPEPAADQFPWHGRPITDGGAVPVPAPTDSDDLEYEELPPAPLPTPMDELLEALLRNDGINVVGIHDVSQASTVNLGDVVFPQARIELSYDAGPVADNWIGVALPTTLRSDGSIDIFHERPVGLDYPDLNTTGGDEDRQRWLRTLSLDGEVLEAIELDGVSGPIWFDNAGGRCGDVPWMRLYRDDLGDIEFRSFGSAAGVLLDRKTLDLQQSDMYDINFDCTADRMVYGLAGGWSSVSAYQRVFAAPLGEADQAVKILDAGLFDVDGDDIFGVEIEPGVSTVYELTADGDRTPLLTLPGSAQFGWTSFTTSPTHLVFMLATTQGRANLGDYTYAHAEVAVFVDRVTRDVRLVQHVSPSGMTWWDEPSVGSTHVVYGFYTAGDRPMLHRMSLEDGSIVAFDYDAPIYLAGDYVGFYDYMLEFTSDAEEPSPDRAISSVDFVIGRWADLSGDTR